MRLLMMGFIFGLFPLTSCSPVSETTLYQQKLKLNSGDDPVLFVKRAEDHSEQRLTIGLNECVIWKEDLGERGRCTGIEDIFKPTGDIRAIDIFKVVSVEYEELDLNGKPLLLICIQYLDYPERKEEKQKVLFVFDCSKQELAGVFHLDWTYELGHGVMQIQRGRYVKSRRLGTDCLRVAWLCCTEAPFSIPREFPIAESFVGLEVRDYVIDEQGCFREIERAEFFLVKEGEWVRNPEAAWLLSEESNRNLLVSGKTMLWDSIRPYMQDMWNMAFFLSSDLSAQSDMNCSQRLSLVRALAFVAGCEWSEGF